MGTRELHLDQYSVAASVPTTDGSIILAMEHTSASQAITLQLKTKMQTVETSWRRRFQTVPA